MQFPINSVHLSIYAGLSCCSVVGLIIYLKNHYKRCEASQSLITLMVCLLGASCFFILANIRYSMFMGRYFFVAIAPIAVFFSVGILNFLPKRAGKIFSIICLVLLVAVSIDVLRKVVIPAYQDFYLKKMTDQNDFSCLSEVVSETNLIHQTFVSPQNNLSCVRVLFSASSKDEALLSIKEHGVSSPVLYSAKFKPDLLSRFQYSFFMFPPIVDSKGKKYDLMVSSAEKTTISLWYAPNDLYAGGKMYVNQDLAGGDLFFATYYCDNSEFVGRWHKSGQVITKQKPFVDFSELQLSYEMEKGFKTNSAVQLKIDQVISSQAVEHDCN